jgi:hypothetical protein
VRKVTEERAPTEEETAVISTWPVIAKIEVHACPDRIALAPHFQNRAPELLPEIIGALRFLCKNLEGELPQDDHIQTVTHD